MYFRSNRGSIKSTLNYFQCSTVCWTPVFKLWSTLETKIKLKIIFHGWVRIQVTVWCGRWEGTHRDQIKAFLFYQMSTFRCNCCMRARLTGVITKCHRCRCCNGLVSSSIIQWSPHLYVHRIQWGGHSQQEEHWHWEKKIQFNWCQLDASFWWSTDYVLVVSGRQFDVT